MKLDNYSPVDIYMSAIKAEIEASKVYCRLAGTVRNVYLERKLLFLASEEDSHRRELSRLCLKETGKRFMRLPAQTPVPMPRLVQPGPNTSAVEVIESAMAAERGARRFYEEFSKLYPAASAQSSLLLYFSNMEKGHLQLLQNELALLGRKGVLPGRPTGPGGIGSDGPCPGLPDDIAVEGLMVRTGALGQARAAVGSVARPRRPRAPAGRWAMEKPESTVLRKKTV